MFRELKCPENDQRIDCRYDSKKNKIKKIKIKNPERDSPNSLLNKGGLPYTLYANLHPSKSICNKTVINLNPPSNEEQQTKIEQDKRKG